MMGIIRLSKFCGNNSGVEPCLPRVLGLSAALSVLLGGAMFWAGYQAGANNQPQITDTVRELIAEERQVVEAAREDARAHVDALALRIAGLQAHLMRLDALGERLVSVGNLDADEFDFDAAPAVGGELAEQGQSQDAMDLQADMARLRAVLEDRERKLLLLEDILMSRQLLSEVMPSGRPVKKGWISSAYGRRTDPFSGKKTVHHGVDFAGKRGLDVIAVASGVVVRSEKAVGYGNLVEVRHADGFSTRYAHNQKNLVSVGDVVTKGQTIALLGSTGRSNGPHVHFEVRKDGRSVNPLKYIKKGE